MGSNSFIDPEHLKDYYRELYDEASNRSSDIGIAKHDREKMLHLASVMLIVGLKRDAPHYTGNLSFNGIKGQTKGKYGVDINILAPGPIDDLGRKLPDYGWQTDMLKRLQFYTPELEYIDVVNRHKGWVERSVRNTLEDLVERTERGGITIV